MVRALRSPDHSTVEYWAVKAKLSPAIGCRFEVAAAAPAPTRCAIALSTSLMPRASATGFWGLKKRPLPFTAACHMSSTVVSAPELGAGHWVGGGAGAAGGGGSWC